jgi:O-antigen/teichoic acid export membrane protein
MTYILVGFGALAVGITALAREALVLLATPAFYAAAPAVGPLALGVLAYATTHITALQFSLHKRTQYFALYAWLASILNVGLNLLLIPRWGMMAASWTTAAAYAFVTVSYLLTSQRFWPVAYETRKAITAVGLTLFFVVAMPSGAAMPGRYGVVLRAAWFVAYLCLLMVCRVVDGGELGRVCRVAWVRRTGRGADTA